MIPPVINPEAAHHNFHHGGSTQTNLYNPDLKQHENPHYYNTNKVLYELYCERSKRETKMV